MQKPKKCNATVKLSQHKTHQKKLRASRCKTQKKCNAYVKLSQHKTHQKSATPLRNTLNTKHIKKVQRLCETLFNTKHIKKTPCISVQKPKTRNPKEKNTKCPKSTQMSYFVLSNDVKPIKKEINFTKKINKLWQK